MNNQCHSKISAISNALFYSGMLMNGTSDTLKTTLLSLKGFPNVSFIDLVSQETLSNNSFVNIREANYIFECIDLLPIQSEDIGVITLCIIILNTLFILNVICKRYV